MVQRSDHAAVMDAQIMLSKEECVIGMGQRSNDAAAKVAQIMLREEECALGMGQKSNDAAVKDAQTKSGEGDYAEGTEHIAHKMNLLHLDQNLSSLLQLKT